MKVLHFGSYWMGGNDIVALMAKDLKGVTEAKIVDTELYTGRPSPWLHKDSDPEHQAVNWINDDKMLELMANYTPDAVVCNAGGMSLTPDMHRELRRRGIVTVGIALSDPDVFAAQGQHYASLFDLYYTNAEVSIAQYEAIGVKARLLPFAASPEFHRPMPSVKKIYDVIIVGHPRADRLAAVKELDKHFNVGLYGKGWKRWGLIPRSRQVNGVEHVKALNTGRAYISFSKTVAGFINVKVGLFEAVACGTAVFTEEFPEMEKYFEYGTEIVGYSSLEELVHKLKNYLPHPSKLTTLAENARARLLRDHTWVQRWEQVLGDVEVRRRGTRR
ncbi:MAG: hypothetical protein FD169_977 [Bacillota bacterium]|nr:MAG: hypothetical protein FD169_977 [Bacillota bacterium]MBS3949121.1 glycosyltransferase [Peptococcaceae bacterium]